VTSLVTPSQPTASITVSPTGVSSHLLIVVHQLFTHFSPLFSLHVGLFFINFSSFNPDSENRANFDAVSSKRANFDKVKFYKYIPKLRDT